MPRYAHVYTKQDAPVRVNPGVIAAEAYGVKTSASDLIHFVELNLRPAQVDKKSNARSSTPTPATSRSAR
jgi:beta-lactamase class C